MTFLKKYHVIVHMEKVSVVTEVCVSRDKCVYYVCECVPFCVKKDLLKQLGRFSSTLGGEGAP